MSVSALVKMATPAPFGKGNATVFDTDVRKALEIPVSGFPDGLFPKQNAPFKNIEEAIDQQMKPDGVKWSYKLYEMHIYEEGGFFLPHKDTLHADNHVATFVVGLPGIEYKGGELVVRHGYRGHHTFSD